MPIDQHVTDKQAPAVLRLVRPTYRGMGVGGRGSLLLDNTNGDADLEMPMPNGEVWRIPKGQRLEVPTQTCGHCGSVVVLHPNRTRERHLCLTCNHYTCDRPGCLAECNPTDLMVELAQKYPEQPWLARGKQGEVLHDPALREKARVY